MRIDETHKPWMIATVVAMVAGAAVYIPYALRTATPGGGTAIGLIFGSVALGLMLFAAMLSVRKRFPIWRIGRAKIWMRAHLWLGFLALPMVLFHAAFHARGALTAVLMVLMVVVVASGVFGAWLQHTLPTRIFREVPFETIYDQIPVIRRQLVAEAEGHAADVTQRMAPATGPGATVVDTLMDLPTMENEIENFRQFFDNGVLPYLHRQGGRGSRFTNQDWVHGRFEELRRAFLPAAWTPLTAIEEICEEKRQLDRQRVLHQWLHGWLMVHLPISAALILLAIVHAIGALRY